MIQLENVTIYKHNTLYFNNLNIHLLQGNTYGIIGRNGSGKTLLFHTIAGNLLPVQGSIIASKEIRWGLVHSEPRYYHFSTVYDYLLHFYELEFHMALQLSHNFGIPLHVPANELPGSKKFLLEVLIALHPENDVILVDNSWGILDNYNRQRLLESLGSYAMDRTIVSFSVNQNDLDSYCQFIYEIDNFGLVLKRSNLECKPLLTSIN
ncbi:MAG TPA: ATP-binding cassette domain-containing protein [Flavisolibacter sp.]|jgi:ABC-2 type transport system ATP-binding protein|nr:ATP-binding cassette domain-containing protein [Flavisolibacter sp.]